MSEKEALPVSAGEEGGVVEEGSCGLGEVSGEGVESTVMEEGSGGEVSGSGETENTVI